MGCSANLEIVASPTQALHDRWRDEMGARDDPSDILCDMQRQLAWIGSAGLDDVDCIWKWRSLALLRGRPDAHDDHDTTRRDVRSWARRGSGALSAGRCWPGRVTQDLLDPRRPARRMSLADAIAAST